MSNVSRVLICAFDDSQSFPELFLCFKLQRSISGSWFPRPLCTDSQKQTKTKPKETNKNLDLNLVWRNLHLDARGEFWPCGCQLSWILLLSRMYAYTNNNVLLIYSHNLSLHTTHPRFPSSDKPASVIFPMSSSLYSSQVLLTLVRHQYPQYSNTYLSNLKLSCQMSSTPATKLIVEKTYTGGPVK